MISTNDDTRIYLNASITEVRCTTHRGQCGYMCIGFATGKPWIDVVRWFVSHKNNPFILSQAKKLISELEIYMNACNWITEGLPDKFYLTTDMSKSIYTCIITAID